MENKIPVQYTFANGEDVLTILQKSFDLYLERILSEQQGFAG